MDTFWGHHNIGLYLVDISMHFRIFYKSRYSIGNIFLVAKISIFLGVLETPDIFFW